MLLDTCALLWLSQGGGQLSDEVCRRIKKTPIVYVSAISGFEVAIKYRKGKLGLPAEPADWFAAIIKHHDLQVLPMDLQTCIRSAQLPSIHSDPCDRMIIASAEIYNQIIVTGDTIFEKYGVKVISP